MRILGLDSSSARGTAALLEEGRVVLALGYEAPQGHAERLLGLVGELLARAGWQKGQLDRIGVGVGPGSFTGIRVGVALAQGIGLGLDRPVVGVGALRAMCRAVPAERPGCRVALVDARKGDVFAGAHAADGTELEAPMLVSGSEVRSWLEAAQARWGPGPLVGEAAVQLGLTGVLRGELTDGPHAIAVAQVAGEIEPSSAPAEPAYVREADAIRPNLPRSPLSSEPPE